MKLETVLYEVRDGVATITLNRPDVMNAWTPQLSDELSLAMGAADADDDVRAVVLTGAGRAFCAGADLSAGESGFLAGGASAKEGPRLMPYKVRKPVIAAINGHAVGVGITYPMLCDIRIVSETAKIQYAMVRRGILPELGSHVLLPRVIGFSRAADLLLTGRLIMGTEAAEMGLASRAVPAGEVLAVATEMARDIAINVSPVSAALAKKLMWDGMNTSIDHMIMTEGKLLPGLAAAPDSGEGVRAFFEKRAPKWRSRVSSDMPVIPK
ncbi:MAG: crotonase [Ilumatobacteraceae bacterium]|nr:crotonase [Ilumatobacteraceae bacterium]